MNSKIKSQRYLALLRDKLNTSIEQQLAILDQSPTAIVMTDLSLNISKTNPQFGKLFNCPDVTASSLEEIVSKFTSNQFSIKTHLLEDIVSQGYVETKIQILFQNGDFFWFQLKGRLTGQAKTPQLVWIFEQQVNKQFKQFNIAIPASIFQSSSAAMMIIDTGFNIVNVNPAFTYITGFSAADLAQKKIFQASDLFVNADEAADIPDVLSEKAHWRGELSVRRKFKDSFAAEVLIDPIKNLETDDTDQIICGFVALFLDITEYKQLEKELRYHAEIDPLTRLANRKLFFQQLDNTLALAKRFKDNVALLYLDLDGFKDVNDSFGHGRGDEVLIEVAQRLIKCVRETDTVARIGGDEFVIILNRTSKPLILETVRRVIESLSFRIIQDAVELNIGASVGIAMYPDDNTNPMTLLKYADAAMYKAKEKGKHQYCWHMPND